MEKFSMDVFTDINKRFKNNIPTIVNEACLERLKKPFLVALLNMNYEDIRREVREYIEENYPDEQYNYIVAFAEIHMDEQAKRVGKNLILTDQVLVELLECTTGKNIITSEERNYKYRQICENIAYDIFGKPLLKELKEANNLDDVRNRFITQVTNLYRDSYTKNKVIQEYSNIENSFQRENDRLKTSYYYDDENNLYYLLQNSSRKNSSSTNQKIQPFSRGNIYTGKTTFYRTMDDMKIRNFPSSDLDCWYLSSFNSANIEMRKKLIACVLDNLQLCYDIYKSYYQNGSKNLVNYLNMTNGRRLSFEYNLNNANMPHLLGISPAFAKDNRGNPIYPNYHKKTLEILFPNVSEDVYCKKNAFEVLEAILNKKDKIVENYGCISLSNSEEDLSEQREMFPWEKIILKTNAFIRGDFFRTTAFYSDINPLSYVFNPSESINGLLINSTVFSQSALNQEPFPSLDKIKKEIKFKKGNCTSYDPRRFSYNRKMKDFLVRALIMDKNSIQTIVSHESFIGERLKKSNGENIESLRKMIYLLKGSKRITPEDIAGGIIASVENDMSKKEFSVDEKLNLLLDIGNIAGDSKAFFDMSSSSSNSTSSDDISNSPTNYKDNLIDGKIIDFDKYKQNIEKMIEREIDDNIIIEYSKRVEKLGDIIKTIRREGENYNLLQQCKYHLERIEEIEKGLDLDNHYGKTK